MLTIENLENHILHNKGISVRLKCILQGINKIYHNEINNAEILKLNNNCHVLEINGERFGVFKNMYEVVIK